jgi:hypothetical protein
MFEVGGRRRGEARHEARGTRHEVEWRYSAVQCRAMQWVSCKWVVGDGGETRGVGTRSR